MEQKKKEQKTAQILYITIIMALLVMALAVGITTAANRGKAPKVTDESEITDKLPDKDHTSPSVTTEKAPVTELTTEKATETTEATTEKATTEKPVVNLEPEIEHVPEFVLPTIGNISKTFTIDTLVFSNTMEDYRTHSGIDICALVGDAVMAAADGVVEEVYEHPMMGHTVVISHKGNSKSVYQNLRDEISVSVGSIVSAGEVIGAVGESAIIEIAEEPHLHFELSVDGQSVNPIDYISKATMSVVYGEE